MRCHASTLGIYKLSWQQDEFSTLDHSHALTLQACEEIERYFNKTLYAFTVPLDLSGYSIALNKWLMCIRQIPYAQQISYSQLATQWGKATAVRAAGSACRRNPIPIIIPCHRVHHHDRKKIRYSGGSAQGAKSVDNIERKQYLIDLELNKLTER